MKKLSLVLLALLSAACSGEQGPAYLDRTVCLGQGVDPGPVQEALDRWNPALAGWARLRLATVGDVCSYRIRYGRCFSGAMACTSVRGSTITLFGGSDPDSYDVSPQRANVIFHELGHDLGVPEARGAAWRPMSPDNGGAGNDCVGRATLDVIARVQGIDRSLLAPTCEPTPQDSEGGPVE